MPPDASASQQVDAPPVPLAPPAQPERRAPAPRPSSTATPGPWARSPVLDARARGIWWGKPPLKMHFFDVTLRNPDAQPRWMVLPRTFPYAGDTTPAPGGDEVQLHVHLFDQHPRVLLVMGVGGDFWAVRLPGKGSVTLRHLAIESWWHELPATAVLEVLVAREVTLGGVALGTLLVGGAVGADATSETGADVEVSRDRQIQSPWEPDAGTYPHVVIDVASRAHVTVELSNALHDP
jgi:hypothetical protein